MVQEPGSKPPHLASGVLRVASAQYAPEPISSLAELSRHIEGFVASAAESHAQAIVFPEYLGLNQPLSDAEGNPRATLRRLAAAETPFRSLLAELSRRHDIVIIGGSILIERAGVLLNAAPVSLPDGRQCLQPKLHLTPYERDVWGLTGGDEIVTFDVHECPAAVSICYDVEFSEMQTCLAQQGVSLLFVPYCTEEPAGFHRVDVCSRARAIENQMFVVTAGLVGKMQGVPGLFLNHAESGIFCPADHGFPATGVVTRSAAGVESLILADLDFGALQRVRQRGSVTPRMDRRGDLFSTRGPTVR